MRKEQFFAKFAKSNIDQRELERKWRVMREQEEWERLMESVRQSSSSPASAPGGGGSGSVGIGNSAVMLSYVDTDDQWKLVVANFGQGTLSTPIETGILYDGGNSYVIDSYLTVHDKGFQIIIWNSALSRSECFFIDASGTLVDTIVTFGGFQYGTLDYIGTWFADFEPDNEPTTEIVFKMFDGENITTHVLTDTSNIQIGGWSGDSFSTYGAVAVLSKTDESFEVRVLKWDGTSDLLFVYEPDVNYTIICSSETDFIVVFDRNANSPYEFTRARKWSGSSLVLEETDLDSGDLVNAYHDFRTYGTNKFITVLYNSDDNTIPHLVYQTSSAGTVTATHANNGDYPYVSFFVTQKEIWYPANVMNEIAVLSFNGDATGGPAPSGFTTYNYYDVMYFTENGAKFDVQFATGNPIAVGFTSSDAGRGGVYADYPVFYFYDPADYTTLSYTLLKDGGSETISTAVDIDDIHDITTYGVSSGKFLARLVLSTDFSKEYYYLYDSNGEIASVETSNNVEYSSPIGINRSTIAIIDIQDVVNSYVWTQNTGRITSLGLTQGNTYIALGFSNVRNDFGTVNALSPGYQVVIEFNISGSPINFFILSNAKGWQGPFPLPQGSYIDYALGESVWYFWLYDENSFFTTCLYSLETGQEIAKYTSDYNAYYGYNEYGDRSSVIFDDGNGNYFFTFPCKTGVTKTITVPQTQFRQSWNDAYWSND